MIEQLKFRGLSNFYDEIEFSVSLKFQSRKISQYKVPGFELIIVDCAKMPNDIDGIRKFLSDFIIPD